jgi:hypothetical protein
MVSECLCVRVCVCVHVCSCELFGCKAVVHSVRVGQRTREHAILGDLGLLFPTGKSLLCRAGATAATRD